MASKTIQKEISIQHQYFTPIQLRLLELLRENGPMTRNQLCETFGFKKHKVVYSTPSLIYKPDGRVRKKLSRRIVELHNKRTTIYDNLVKLQKRKLVEKFSRNNGKRGRPFVFWKIKK